jgi:hypothetical protein
VALLGYRGCGFPRQHLRPEAVAALVCAAILVMMRLAVSTFLFLQQELTALLSAVLNECETVASKSKERLS